MMLIEKFVDIFLSHKGSFTLFIVVEGRSEVAQAEQSLERNPRNSRFAIDFPLREIESFACQRCEIGGLHLHLPPVVPAVLLAEVVIEGILHYPHELLVRCQHHCPFFDLFVVLYNLGIFRIVHKEGTYQFLQVGTA